MVDRTEERAAQKQAFKVVQSEKDWKQVKNFLYRLDDEAAEGNCFKLNEFDCVFVSLPERMIDFRNGALPEPLPDHVRWAQNKEYE